MTFSHGKFSNVKEKRVAQKFARFASFFGGGEGERVS